MTENEMWSRIDELGALNPKTALIVSIEKWKWMTWKNRNNAYWGMDTCALCQEHYVKHRNFCTTCPLYDKNGGCEDDSLYEQMGDARENEDKVAYMKARRNIIRRMERALKKLEAEEK